MTMVSLMTGLKIEESLKREGILNWSDHCMYNFVKMAFIINMPFKPDLFLNILLLIITVQWSLHFTTASLAIKLWS